MAANVKKVQITQIILSDAFMRRDEFGFMKAGGKAINKQVGAALTCAEKHGVHLLVFPELAVPQDQSFRNRLKKWSEKNHAVVVGGSFYAIKRKGESIVVTPTCPVYVSGTEILVPKFCISPFEDPLRKNVTFELSDCLKTIPGTPAGNLGISICSDVFDEQIQQQVKANAELDILCVPALQKDPRLHFRSLAEMCRHASDGMFVVYANSLWTKYSGGGSSVFGLLHRAYREKILSMKMSEPTVHEEHLLQMPDCARNLVVSIDLSMRRPVQANSVKDTSPIKVVYGDYRSEAEGNRFIPIHGTRTSPKIRIVAFDADGTLIKGLKFSWQLLWTFLYGEESDRMRESLREAYKRNVAKNPENRQLYYEEWCDQCCKKFKEKKLTRDQILSLCKGLKPADNLVTALQHIKQVLNCRLVLVSGGLDVIAKAVLGKEAWDLFDSHYINVMSFTDEGYLSHIEPTQFDYDGKYDALSKEALSINCLPANVAFIGDEHNDRVALSRIHLEGGLAIAFGHQTGLSQEEVSSVIVSNDLLTIQQAIVSHNSKLNRSAKESVEKGFIKRYTSEFHEKETGFREAYSVLQSWVNSLGPQSHSSWMGKIKHDNDHRQRVLRTVGWLTLPNFYASRYAPHLAFLAHCAVAVHDIGLQLPIGLYIPGADVYPSEVQARLTQRRHHNVASNVLRQISEGHYTDEFIAAVEGAKIKRSSESIVLSVLKDTCRILSEINVFHDANEQDLFGVHAELRSVLTGVSWFKASPEDVNYLGAVIRLADRLDRHHKRLKNARDAELFCSDWSNHGINSDVPGVVIDSAVVADCKVAVSRYGQLSVEYSLPKFRSKQAIEFAHMVLEERVLPRIRDKRPWYVRQIEKQISVNVAEPVASGQSGIGQQRTDMHATRTFAPESCCSLNSVVAEVLACTPVDSWLRSVVGKNIVCGGSEHSFSNNTSVFSRPEVVFDIAEWGIADLSRPFLIESRQNIANYLGTGGTRSRLKDLAALEPSEWDIYIPFSDKKAHECRMLLNAHIPFRLGYSRDRARDYMNLLAREVRPYTDRLITTLMNQHEKALALVRDGYGSDFAGEIERIRRGEDGLETIDLATFIDEIYDDRGSFLGAKMGNQQHGKFLFPDIQPPILGAVHSKAILRALCKAASSTSSKLGDFAFELVEHQKLPINSISFMVTISEDTKKRELEQLESFSKFCCSAEVFIPETDGSELSQCLRQMHSLARLSGIGIRSKCVGNQFEIALSVVGRSHTK